jgi:hypothetical protein
MSSVLGSMSTDTSCVVNFTWMFPGSGAYQDILGINSDVSDDVVRVLQKGYENHVRKNRPLQEIMSADQSIKKHSYLNQRQYVGRNSS